MVAHWVGWPADTLGTIQVLTRGSFIRRPVACRWDTPWATDCWVRIIFRKRSTNFCSFPATPSYLLYFKYYQILNVCLSLCFYIPFNYLICYFASQNILILISIISYIYSIEYVIWSQIIKPCSNTIFKDWPQSWRLFWN